MDPFKPLAKIPEFYRNRNAGGNNNSSENSKIKEQQRFLFLNRLSREIIPNDKLQHLWSLLEKSALNNNNQQHQQQPQTINYIQFKDVSKQLTDEPRLQKYFQAKIFQKLSNEFNDNQSTTAIGEPRISITTFFRYIMRKCWLRQAQISLSFWDSSNTGYLTELDLENYIRLLIPTLTKLNNMDKSYHPFYICMATRKFFFILDPHKHNRIRIIDILFSGLLDDLLELRDNVIATPNNQCNYTNNNNSLNESVATNNTSVNHMNQHHQSSNEIVLINNKNNRQQQQQHQQQQQQQLMIINNDFNWFSSLNTIRLYNIYVDLDDDHNGMISKSEFLKFGNFNELFIEQLFDVCMTYNKEIDFKTFIDIILALENRKLIQSQYFFFQILDIKHCNYLDDYVLRYFFKAIESQMYRQGQEPINFDDFSNEIYDMIPQSSSSSRRLEQQHQQRRIYFEDLVASGYADTIISILIDFNGFYAYENRDSNIRLRNYNNMINNGLKGPMAAPNS